jgi:hypothetical protein
MDVKSIKTGDVFYYEDYIPHMNKTHRHKCRVLFVGDENIFYDGWWDGIGKWAFVPVTKRLTYYRFPITHLHRLTFNGYEEIDTKSENKLFLQSPEVLLRATKNEIFANQSNDTAIELNSEKFCFVPTGPKGGWLNPILFDSNALTRGNLIDKVLKNQNLDFIQTENIIVDRIGLHSGVPSYNIRTQ